MDTVNPFLLLIVVGCGCGLLVLRESPKAAKAFSVWLFSHQAGREAYREAHRQYREKHARTERTEKSLITSIRGA